MAEYKPNFQVEIRIAQFWRRQLGEYEYVNHNPDDLQRWYIALETRGPEEIRQYLIERTGRHPMPCITGIVARAPHPSREIVDLWLASHVKTRTAGYWLAAPVFIAFVYLFATNLEGFQNLKSKNKLAANPPAIGALGNAMPPPKGPASTLPANLPGPAAKAATPTAAYSGGPSAPGNVSH